MTHKLKALTLIVVLALAIVVPAGGAYAAIDSYLVQDENGVVYLYDLVDLLNSYTEGTDLWTHFMSMTPFGVHDSVSGKYVDFNAVLEASTNGTDITQYTESTTAVGANMPATFKKVTLGQGGELNFQDMSSAEVTGTVTKLGNYPLLGSTTIRVTLSGTTTPQSYSVTVNGTKLVYNAQNQCFEKALVSTDTLAQMSVEELQAALQIEESGEFMVVDIY